MVKGPDKLGRRDRFDPQPTGKRISLQKRDWLWLKKLHEHGPLPSSFLLAYSKDSHASKKRAIERLADLFHENDNVHDGQYLTRPKQQTKTIDSRYNQLVYDLTKTGKKALAQEFPDLKRGNLNAGPWVHKLMVSCITASIDLACKQRDEINYIPASAILERTETELRYPVTFTMPGESQSTIKELIPDALFGLEYVTGESKRYRFFAVEADRSTETGITGNVQRKSLLRSFLQYQAYVEGDLYKQHLNLTAPLLVLNVANSRKRMEQMLFVTASLFPSGSSYLLFQHWDDFGEMFKPPEPWEEILTVPWQRSGLEILCIEN